MNKTEILIGLGTNIRKIREAKGISQKELAHKIGKDQQSLQRLEAGRINPSFYYLFEVARGLDVELSRLMADE